MLFYASFSTGIMALFVGFAGAITLVGVYVIVVWPLTFWDLGNLGLERYSSWTGTIVASVFGLGSLIGLCYFSGVGSRHKQVAVMPNRPMRSPH
jgi:hypothetical protein